MTATDTARDIEKVWDIVEDVDFCMLTTISGGELRARPMSSHADRAAGAILFLTDVRGHKDEEIAADPRACLGYAATGKNLYLSVTGHASIENDRAKIRELWDAGADMFWPKGPDDENVRVLRFEPSRAEWWDGPNAVVVALKMAKAKLTGGTPDFGENRKVTLG